MPGQRTRPYQPVLCPLRYWQRSKKRKTHALRTQDQGLERCLSGHGLGFFFSYQIGPAEQTGATFLFQPVALALNIEGG